ncbi:MAG: carboxypeptidase-like regulatory domain-containing protein [Candidatus Eiseniibacteriota bacterium]
MERAWILAGACMAVAGCGLSGEKLTAPAPGAPQVTGIVLRAGVPVVGMEVKLYQDPGGVQAGSALTDGAGAYGFANVPAGRWMVKVSPPDTSDLGYVRYFIDLATAGAPAMVPPFDIASHGFWLVAPADGAAEPLPNMRAGLHLEWSAYRATYLWTSARVSDSTGASVWSSPAGQATFADWDGTGNEGSYSGQHVRSGPYQWRVRIRLPNGVQAASRQRVLDLGLL